MDTYPSNFVITSMSMNIIQLNPKPTDNSYDILYYLTSISLKIFY